MKKYIYILVLFYQFVAAQNEGNIWYFGYGAGLDFNSGTAVPISGGQLYTYAGCASISDANGDVLSYRWSILSQPETSTIALANANTIAPSITPIVDGSYVVQLIVNDGSADSAPVSMSITAQTANSIPIVNAGIDQSL